MRSAFQTEYFYKFPPELRYEQIKEENFNKVQNLLGNRPAIDDHEPNIVVGIDNTKIMETFKPVIEIIVETESITEAVKVANKIAIKKDNVLLSPACASYDLFNNYEDRGDQFKEAVRSL